MLAEMQRRYAVYRNDEYGYITHYINAENNIVIRVEYGSLSHNRPVGFTPFVGGKAFRSCQRLKDAKEFAEAIIKFKSEIPDIVKSVTIE